MNKSVLMIVYKYTLSFCFFSDSLAFILRSLRTLNKFSLVFSLNVVAIIAGLILYMPKLKII